MTDKNNALFLEALKHFNTQRKISDTTTNKGTEVVLNTQIIVLSESKDQLRQRNNAKSLAQSFDAITDDNSLSYQQYNYKFDPLKFSLGAEVNKMSSK